MAGGHHRGNYDKKLHNESVHPTGSVLAAGHESLKLAERANRAYRKDINPVIEQNLDRLLTLKRELCCVPGCKRKHIYWTPNGVFCGAHRDEAMAAMREAKVKRYGGQK